MYIAEKNNNKKQDRYKTNEPSSSLDIVVGQDKGVGWKISYVFQAKALLRSYYFLIKGSYY